MHAFRHRYSAWTKEFDIGNSADVKVHGAAHKTRIEATFMERRDLRHEMMWWLRGVLIAQFCPSVLLTEGSSSSGVSIQFANRAVPGEKQDNADQNEGKTQASP